MSTLSPNVLSSTWSTYCQDGCDLPRKLELHQLLRNPHLTSHFLLNLFACLGDPFIKNGYKRNVCQIKGLFTRNANLVLCVTKFSRAIQNLILQHKIESFYVCCTIQTKIRVSCKQTLPRSWSPRVDGFKYVCRREDLASFTNVSCVECALPFFYPHPCWLRSDGLFFLLPRKCANHRRWSSNGFQWHVLRPGERAPTFSPNSH
jgi:hypothetical protein